MPFYRGTHYPLLNGSRPLDPASVSKLVFWFKADAIKGLADGDPVATWPDSSGLGRDATQATAAKKPTYRASRSTFSGQPVVEFDSADDFVQTASFTAMAQPNTVFAVAKVGATGAQRFMIDGFDFSNRHALFQESSTNWQYYAGSLVNDGTSNTNVHLFQALFNGASSVLRVDGGAGTSGNAGSNNLTGLTLGAQPSGTSNWGGDIAEVIVYNMSLSATEINGVALYLGAKYGLVWATI